jgi:hypothetical protein
MAPFPGAVSDAMAAGKVAGGYCQNDPARTIRPGRRGQRRIKSYITGE